MALAFPQPRTKLTRVPGGPVMSSIAGGTPVSALPAVPSMAAKRAGGDSGYTNGGYGVGAGGVQPVSWGPGAPGAGGTVGFPTPGTGTGVPGSGGATYSSQLDPGIKGVMDTMMARFAQPYATNTNLASRLSDDTTKSLVTRATGQVRDEARGADARAQAIEAKGGPAANSRAIDEAMARRSAGVTTDITNERAKAKDTLAMNDAALESAWGQGQNAVLGAAGGMATAGAQNQISQILAQQGAQAGAWSQLQQVMALMTGGATAGRAPVVAPPSYRNPGSVGLMG